MTIKILPAILANQIAAGEVVERPASVIKELVENSIDAGATDILIELDKGGHKRMLIRDNGKGIPKEELSLALSRHATSKIQDIDDLESITSLGFRGEALASISSVSRLTLTSKTADQTEAWQAHSEGRDMQIQLNPAAHPKGCSVEVLDLFFNTPARRKFLKAEKTEFQHIEEIIKRIALSHYEVAFTLKHNGRVVHRFPAVVEELKHKRIANVCGQGFVDTSIAIHGEFEGVVITGWCNAVGQGRRTNDLQYSFVNGRMMKDKVIIHAIRQAFEGMIDSQTYPSFVLFITMPPDELDINVHPAKHEVRFHKTRQVHDLIYKSISDALLLSASTSEIEFTQEELESDGKQDGLPAASKVSDLFAEVKHGYGSSPTPSPQSYATPSPNADYIAPLQQKESRLSQSNYTPKSSGFQGKGQVSKSASVSYQNLMSSQSSRNEESRIEPSWLLLPNNQMLVKQASNQKTRDESLVALSLLPAWFVPAEALFKQIQSSQVQQPLLMPVSVKEQEPPAMLDEMKTLGMDIQFQMNKWILKQVPAALRQLPWVSIFPQLVAHSKPVSGAQELMQILCMYWSQAHEFSYVEIDNWLSSLATSEQSELLQKFGSAFEVPINSSVEGMSTKHE
ncbi:MAG: DNA mismatch repair endonuclease MutL [Glaciecola sp.]